MRVHFSWAARGNPCLSFGKAGKYVDRELRHLCELVAPDAADLQIYLGIPLYDQRGQWKRRNDRYVWFTMWESPQVPDRQIARINNAEGVISPCPWVDTQYEKRGVSIPRFVVPLGFDPEIYRPIQRSKRKTFTFLWLGVTAGHVEQLADHRQKRIGDRKRGWMVREAFKRLGLGSDARLILKGVPWPHGRLNIAYRTSTGSEIVEIIRWMTEEQMWELYAEGDIFVWPSWGEGFGLPPLEAAATGLPSILPNYSALEAYHDPSWCLDLPYTVGRIWRAEKYHGARIAIEDLMSQMLWAYEHRDEVLDMGKAAATVAHEKWTWEKATRPGLARVLEYYN